MWMTGEDDEGGDDSLRGMPILTLADQESGWVSSWLVTKKGANWYAIQALNRQIEEVGVQKSCPSERPRTSNQGAQGGGEAGIRVQSGLRGIPGGRVAITGKHQCTDPVHTKTSEDAQRRTRVQVF